MTEFQCMEQVIINYKFLQNYNDHKLEFMYFHVLTELNWETCRIWNQLQNNLNFHLSWWGEGIEFFQALITLSFIVMLNFDCWNYWMMWLKFIYFGLFDRNWWKRQKKLIANTSMIKIWRYDLMHQPVWLFLSSSNFMIWLMILPSSLHTVSVC